MRKLLLTDGGRSGRRLLFRAHTRSRLRRVTAAEAPCSQSVVERTVRGRLPRPQRHSDGAGGRRDAIAAAAARAGLRFVIFTDHGDGTRAPEAPRRTSHGVLCIDAVEISTNGGHYVALDMRPSTYPLGGEASAVVEDVRRLGGFGIAAHPVLVEGRTVVDGLVGAGRRPRVAQCRQRVARRIGGAARAASAYYARSAGSRTCVDARPAGGRCRPMGRSSPSAARSSRSRRTTRTAG